MMLYNECEFRVKNGNPVYYIYWKGEGYDPIDEEELPYDANYRMKTNGECIVVDSNSFVVAGETTSNTFPVKNAFQEKHLINIIDVKTSIFLSFFTF